jgi:hypothetical protein
MEKSRICALHWYPQGTVGMRKEHEGTNMSVGDTYGVRYAGSRLGRWEEKKLLSKLKMTNIGRDSVKKKRIIIILIIIHCYVI